MKLPKQFLFLAILILLIGNACRSAPEAESTPTPAPLAAESSPPPVTTSLTLRFTDNQTVDTTATDNKVTYETLDTDKNTIACQGTIAGDTQTGDILSVTCDNAPACTITFNKDTTAVETTYVQGSTVCS